MSSGIIPLVMLCATGILWFATVLYAHHLLHAFCSRFPAQASREIPYAFDRWFAHPEKGIFFYRRRAADIVQVDPTLRKKRTHFILLSILSVSFPLAWFLPLFIYAVVMSQK